MTTTKKKSPKEITQLPSHTHDNPNTIHTPAHISNILGNHLYQATAPNGHILLCHFPKKTPEPYPILTLNHPITLACSPYDLSKARIVSY